MEKSQSISQSGHLFSKRILWISGGLTLSTVILGFFLYKRSQKSCSNPQCEAICSIRSTQLLQNHLHELLPIELLKENIKTLERILPKDLVSSPIAQIAKKTQNLFSLVLHSKSTQSTQDNLDRIRSFLPLKMLVYTDDQLKGRGTKGTSWDTIPGSILMSFSLVLGKEWRQAVALLSCLCLCQSLEKLGLPREELSIKLPNDVLWQGNKISGCLGKVDELPESPGAIYIMLGVGINTTTAAETHKKYKTLPVQFTRELVMIEYFENLERVIKDFDEFKREIRNWIAAEALVSYYI